MNGQRPSLLLFDSSACWHLRTCSWRGRQNGPKMNRHGSSMSRRIGLMTTVVVASVFAVAGLTRPALAWGRMAHRASARFAESRLSPRARASIRDLLEPGESLADASTWADEHGREISGSASWHYVNVSVAAEHYDPRDCRSQGCVISKINEFRSVLMNPNTPHARRRTALRFYIHLIQDLHQPMHVADRNDRGGNALQLRYGRSQNTNLHQVWDSGLFHEGFHNETNLMRKLEDLADGPGSSQWLKGRIEDWADESLAVGRGAYLVPGSQKMLRSGDTLGREYERVNLPLATDRLARSGLRLAMLLNDVFK